ncbi:RNA polymerase II transcription factor SIII (Elongin) subunit A domain-containing protein [Hirsutella rhossiliensis]|uniref:RNA polymerase II transcription factor SIII (Elongin) subunit A domain-containing protein n=1 Tax=Hirsutella rhossiliensis TaxID=111463 RepID=A0A9P8SLD1_9HYPO|nr:RNA polymerase II transcription factor SIII (Elongin) subunit A domain-containing protein [Hirsutella rhossiliensis]KAH0967353.1 RNA polymerase II transcription factor SIII (Elongin) subunit A domain-containing protein [Hirsutella rhossiliensis]
MTVKSLMELATMSCIKNIKALESIGDYLPYESMRHILLKIDNAYQLRQIEINSPQIQGETGELWIRLIEKDFPLEYKANAYKPSSPDKWYRVWEKYKKEHATALEESERKLMNALAGLKESKEKNTSKIIERKFLPRAGRVGPKRVWGQRDHTSSTLTFNSGSRTKTHTGASVMRKVRREVKEIANIHGSLSKVIRGPTRHVELKKAPAAMVSDYQRAAQPQFRGAAKAPEPVSAVEQYEQRATVISDSEEDEDHDDFFGDAERTAPAQVGSSPTKNIVSEAAKVSLLKKKPAALRAQPSTTTQKQDGSGAPVKAANRGAATMANKFRRSTTMPRAVSVPSADEASSPPSTMPADESTEADSRLAPSKTSPAPDNSAGQSSPKDTAAAPSEASPPPIQRKRKAVDIFMRRKKRAV